MLVLTPKAELVYEDASASTAALTLHFPIGTSVETALSACEALGAVVAPITGCVLTKLRLKYIFREDAIGTPDVGASITRRAVFFGATGTDLPDAVIELPGIKDSVLVADGPTAGYAVDLSNSDVIAFTDGLVAENATNIFGDAITAVLAAYIQSRV